MSQKPKIYAHISRTGQETKHRCLRCHRILPWDQFKLLGDPQMSMKIWTKLAYNRDVQILHPVCTHCKSQYRGRWVNHPLYSPKADRFFEKAFSRLKSGARKRGIAVLIDKDDILGAYLKQGGMCAMSGLKLNPVSGWGSKNTLAPSVDRIDSHGNYDLGNIQIVCTAVNLMKQDMSYAEFVRMCQRIVDNTDAKELELFTALEVA